jgi:hypothetical protein
MPRQDLHCVDTLITVAPDCKARSATVPMERGGKPTVATIQYDMLAGQPYHFTQEEVLFESHIRRSELAPSEIKRRRKELWEEFFSRSQACLRASPLPKSYGWGIHFDKHGKAALVARESSDYDRLVHSTKRGVKCVPAMRNKRAAKTE